MQIQDYQFYTNLTNLKFVHEIWLFGSRARRDNQERADIDIAIYCANASDSDWHAVSNIIDNADTLLKIDCVRLDQLSSFSELKKSIYEEGIKIYERK